MVKASPDDPPLSVNLLYQLAQQQGLDCSLKSHVHSSCPGQVPNELIELFDTSCDSGRLCLRFIWKSGKFCWLPPERVDTSNRDINPEKSQVSLIASANSTVQILPRLWPIHSLISHHGHNMLLNIQATGSIGYKVHD